MQPVVDLAKSFERRKCNHREVVPGDACLKDVIGKFKVSAPFHEPSLKLSRRNKQTPLRRRHAISIPSLIAPLRTCCTNRPCQPFGNDSRTAKRCHIENQRKSESDLSCTFLPLITRAKSDEAALRPAEAELSKLSVSVQQAEIPRKKKKGPKGPNPLSVKKKKPAVTQIPRSEPTSTGSKRKREDEQDVADTLAGASQARSGHKRKRRRKTETELSTGHACA
jgi:U3 small nucleolar RNA-associated protein 23